MVILKLGGMNERHYIFIAQKINFVRLSVYDAKIKYITKST